MDHRHADQILTIQLAVAYAGEAESEPARLAWWRTSMVDEYGGHDLLRRLAPRTWEWGALEVAREAARRVEDRMRDQVDQSDHLVSLFRLGFELDEPVDERLGDLKQRGKRPAEALPELNDLMEHWSQDRFAEWLAGLTEPLRHTPTATGRRLSGSPSDNPVTTASNLATALLPLSDEYPLPHFRIAR